MFKVELILTLKKSKIKSEIKLCKIYKTLKLLSPKNRLVKNPKIISKYK